MSKFIIITILIFAVAAPALAQSGSDQMCCQCGDIMVVEQDTDVPEPRACYTRTRTGERVCAWRPYAFYAPLSGGASQCIPGCVAAGWGYVTAGYENYYAAGRMCYRYQYYMPFIPRDYGER